MSKGLLGPTHNLMSNIMAASKQPTPEVGMGATQLMYTDRYAGTIVELVYKKDGSLKGFYWQEDNAKRTDSNGMSDSQQYEYTPNTESEKILVTLRKNGRYVKDGEGLWNGTSFGVGYRQKYHDFSF